MNLEPIFETENLTLHKVKKEFEIRLEGNVHSVLVGTVSDFEKGKKFMERAERYPANLKRFLNHK